MSGGGRSLCVSLTGHVSCILSRNGIREIYPAHQETLFVGIKCAFYKYNLSKEAAMNNDQFKGQWKQFKGELKSKWGDLTDDDLLEAEGDYDKFLGVVQKRYGDKKEELKNWAEDWYSKREREEIIEKKATESRNQK
jgi:uncharacterized protein YjbJ (UPF0337 family)